MPFNFNGNTVNGVTFNGNTVNKVNYNGVTVWESGPAPAWGGLCFTAEEANSTVELTAVGDLTGKIANTAYSTDGINWTTFTPSATAGTNTIVLANVGDKVYFRNDMTDGFASSTHLKFVLSGKIAASGNCNSIYVHEGFEELTSLVYGYCYYGMFQDCPSLTTAPELPATTLKTNCYSRMFYGCTSLTTVSELPATTLEAGCYSRMFYGCTNIKMSETQSDEYPNEYTFGAVPNSTYAGYMFASTGGSFKGTPTVQTLYTSNTII